MIPLTIVWSLYHTSFLKTEHKSFDVYISSKHTSLCKNSYLQILHCLEIFSWTCFRNHTCNHTWIVILHKNITFQSLLSKSRFEGNRTNTFGRKVIMKNLAKLVKNFWQSIKISHDLYRCVKWAGYKFDERRRPWYVFNQNFASFEDYTFQISNFDVYAVFSI